MPCQGLNNSQKGDNMAAITSTPNPAPSAQKYTVKESGNLGLGQAGSSFVKTATSALSGVNVVAITIIEDATFSELTARDTIVAGVSAAGVSGDAIDNSLTFPAGITIYGSWTNINVSAGSVICYHG